MGVLDGLIEIIQLKGELEKRGVWQRINAIEEDRLESQLDDIAVEVKKSDNKLQTITDMFEKDPGEVAFNRGSDFDRAMEDIERAAKEKSDEDQCECGSERRTVS